MRFLIPAPQLRAWIDVHQTRSAALEIGLAACIGVAAADGVIERFGPISLNAPVSTLLFTPAIAAIGAATATISDHQPITRPPALYPWARAGWALLALAVATIASTLGLALTDNTSTAAVIRNLAIFYCISIPATHIARGHLVWAPALVYCFAAMLFGPSESTTQYAWWAAVLSNETQTVLPWYLTAFALIASSATLEQLTSPKT